MKLVRNALIVVLLLLGIAALVGLIRSNEYTVERSVAIAAHPMRVYRYVTDLARWDAWHPWNTRSWGEYEITRGDTTANVGATQTWTSRFGGGEVTFTDVNVVTGLKYDFRWKGNWRAKATILCRGFGDSTIALWRLEGKVEKPVVGSYIADIMDAMIGGTLDYGLGELKKAVEADTSHLYMYIDGEEVELP